MEDYFLIMSKDYRAKPLFQGCACFYQDENGKVFYGDVCFFRTIFWAVSKSLIAWKDRRLGGN